ncbi:orotidine 5'-phosphate decarboxylase [Vagococcus carniphilus]|uniref:Orotidine 5'-phosphate decarboxylase n=1 Tax=Vagococcus carniphilus TaxID=218144 RepID=A0AAW8UD37_9ENTE|nr:orotidine 5'-phosphate decarboxylase / HUMPS family protein [Vagococcus carniphilus]MDT2831052.1 orotidine 5'-phosphate decarboxylase [Vagococcus carniphilus]MDT2834895.1 orotidine 5'-phosphate decarboxylase [Vagococcus carniphilus]MDT2838051.1 orotidine 5'-phosphate decarboxylase [Vagococcus carniphilus]MDT2853788.1 orotidine 5'-phosphate decarboxylase [Vagococcus carniphilus]
MKLQVAIDRVSLEEAVNLSKRLDGQVDLIEMGTSLVKDYGIEGIKQIRNALSESDLLIDLKTIDEGAYEFKQGFTFGGDVLTVMGASSIETIRACYKVSREYQKTMMIDLLEVNEEKIKELEEFEEAVFCLHHSIDKVNDWHVLETISTFQKSFPKLKRLAIAGGIDLTQAKELNQQGLIEIIVVGSHITKSKNVVEEASKFMEELKNERSN